MTQSDKPVEHESLTAKAALLFCRVAGRVFNFAVDGIEEWGQTKRQDLEDYRKKRRGSAPHP